MRARVKTDIGTGRLEDAVRQRDELLAVVSHDLRNPLGAIELAAQMLEVSQHDPLAKKQVQIIRRATKRMEHLIRDLQDVSSLYSGHFEIEKKPEPLMAVICEIVDAQEQVANEKGVQFVRDLRVEELQVACDRDRVSQVLANLLSNAIKFCRANDTITVRAEYDEWVVRITVEDTGPGITGDELPNIFDPYWTSKRHGKKGNGLGLYISKGIVDAHGGTIEVASRPDVATAFTVTLPIV
jgi:signal transduction histidine kinase